ncbi:MAG: translation elongation factor Ts [Kiritimatiellae bacterium]|nr:translation elongation factor Ts [Kiritimatiellia bacterium]
MTITVAMINDLRQRTNAGMMDCKKALIQTDGDMEAAIKVLREKGLAIQVKRADKESKQGIIQALTSADGKTVAMAEVNTETDFVAATDNFKKFVNTVTTKVLEGTEDLDGALKEDLMTIISQTGENVKIRRTARYTLEGSAILASYIHMGGKIGVIIEVGAEKAETLTASAFTELVHDLTLQIAANAPRYIAGAEVPQAEVDAELEIKLNALKEQKGKLPPEQALVGIKKGMTQKFFSEICLLDQPFVKNGVGDKTTISQLIAKIGKDLGDTITVKRFVRYQLGAK